MVKAAPQPMGGGLSRRDLALGLAKGTQFTITPGRRGGDCESRAHPALTQLGVFASDADAKWLKISKVKN